jgi:hypothetical protein
MWATKGRVSGVTVKVEEQTPANTELSKQGTFTGMAETVKVTEDTQDELTHFNDLHGVTDSPPAEIVETKWPSKRKKPGIIKGATWEDLGSEPEGRPE